MIEVWVKRVFAIAASAAICIGLAVSGASAQNRQPVKGERYIPSIWVDPDGCEHWVMDDGAEGYMTPHVNRQGIPICRAGKLCGVMPTDQFFATNQATINAEGRQRLQDFFNRNKANYTFVIAGHTDNRASDEYNLSLSERRAAAVAQVAQSTGARVNDVRAYGERQPRASNDTARGMAENRRVEITCLK